VMQMERSLWNHCDVGLDPETGWIRGIDSASSSVPELENFEGRLERGRYGARVEFIADTACCENEIRLI
jgi:hypothetical protein